MKKKRNKQLPVWTPAYPESPDCQVDLLEKDFETFLLHNRPVINLEVADVENPACFWIDQQHVYVRVNWSMWGTVSLANPGQIAAICNSHFCQVVYSWGNTLGDCMVPVYHIDALPKKLCLDNDPTAVRVPEPSEVYQKAMNQIENTIRGANLNLTVSQNVQLGEERVPFLISGTNHKLILYVLPDEDTFQFLAPKSITWKSWNGLWALKCVPLDFLARAKEQRVALARQEPNAVIDVGLLASPQAIRDFTRLSSEIPCGKKGSYFDLIPDFKFMIYDDIKMKLTLIFSGKQSLADQMEKFILDFFDIMDSPTRKGPFVFKNLVDVLYNSWELSRGLERTFGCIIPDVYSEKVHTVPELIDWLVNTLPDY